MHLCGIIGRVHVSRYGNGWNTAVAALDDTSQLLAAAGDALVSLEAVPTSTQSTASHPDSGTVDTACLLDMPHFEPGVFASRDRMPLAQAILLLQHPPPGWRHYLNLDAAATGPKKGTGPRRGAPMNRAPFDQLEPPSFVPTERLLNDIHGETASAEINLWLGGGVATTQLHADPCGH